MKILISTLEFLAVAFTWVLVLMAILVIPNMFIKELYPAIKSFLDTHSKL